MTSNRVWIDIHTTEVTVDGQVFTVKTDAINKYGIDKVIAHIRQHFSELKNE